MPIAGTMTYLGFLLCICASLLSCDRDGPQSVGSQDDEPRIVTLAPSLTQMLLDLGMAEQIVGVAEHDKVAPSHAAVVGNYLDVNTETLVRLNPTHVLMMSGRNEPPAHLRQLAARGSFELIDYDYPDTVDEIFDILIDTPAGAVEERSRSLGVLFGKVEQAQAMRVSRLTQLQAIAHLTAEREPVNVLIVIGLNPVMASGPGSVHDDLLTSIGATNVAAATRTSAPTFDAEALIALQPEVILLIRPGDPPLTPGDARLRSFRSLPLPAVRDERIYLLSEAWIDLPGTCVVEIAAAMARAVHPDLTDRIDVIMRLDAP